MQVNLELKLTCFIAAIITQLLFLSKMNEPPLPPKHLPDVKEHVAIKICLLGDSYVGKTCLMTKFINNEFIDTYRKTTGVNYMDKSYNLATTDIIEFSIYDLGGDPEYQNMLPLAVSDSLAICYCFDLTKKESLVNVERWWKLTKIANENPDIVPVLIGTKYDLFVEKSLEYQEEMYIDSLKYAKALGSPIIFTSAAKSVNIQKILKVVTGLAFDLKNIDLPQFSRFGEPILIFKKVLIDGILLEYYNSSNPARSR